MNDHHLCHIYTLASGRVYPFAFSMLWTLRHYDLPRVLQRDGQRLPASYILRSLHKGVCREIAGVRCLRLSSTDRDSLLQQRRVFQELLSLLIRSFNGRLWTNFSGYEKVSPFLLSNNDSRQSLISSGKMQGRYVYALFYNMKSLKSASRRARLRKY